jgi:large subunit ribosomal protein L15
MKLNDLIPNPGSKKDRKRVGHGISAGQGKTSGRGTKGQASRTGEGPRLYNQGGNLPFYRRLPFMRGEGFTPINRIEYQEVNLAQLSSFEAGSEITPDTLAQAFIIRKAAAPVVILGDGDIKVALKVRAHRVTKTAKAKIEAVGGTVEII